MVTRADLRDQRDCAKSPLLPKPVLLWLFVNRWWGYVEPTGLAHTEKSSSRLDRDVVGVHIDDEDAEGLHDAQNGLHLWPGVAELFKLLGVPVGHDLVGEFGSVIEIGAAEIEEVGAFDDAD